MYFPSNAEKKNENLILALSFMIWPFGVFLYSIYHFREARFRILILAFYVLYGLTFNIGTASHGLDSFKVVKEFNSYLGQDRPGIISVFENLYTSGKVDLFKWLLYYLISSFTANYHILYAAVALIYGYFFLKSVEVLVNELPEKKNTTIYHLIYIFLFFLFIRFSAINGIRFWVAAMVAMYALHKIFFTQDKRYILLLISTIFIHFSYIVIIFTFFGYYLLKNKPKLFLLLPILGFIFADFFRSNIIDIGAFLGEGTENKVQAYTDSYYLSNRAARRAQTDWFIQIYNQISYFSTLVVFVILWFSKRIRMDSRIEKIFLFLITFLTVLIIAYPVYDLFTRFADVLILFFISFLLMITITNKIKIVKILALFLASGYLLEILVNFRAAIETVDPIILYSNVPFILYDFIIRFSI